MQILLTFDYEVFFGDDSGSIEKCMIEPSNRLMEIAKQQDIKLVFFVDIGYYIQLKKQNSAQNTQDLLLFEQQVKSMVAQGHDVQLHIHPHWEKAVFEQGKWKFNMHQCYKLADFPDEAIEEIISRYKAALDNLSGQKSIAFRAGGWCIQPFDRLKNSFHNEGIRIDSSVFAGAKFYSEQYAFDFSSAPKKDHYRFQNDVNMEDCDGEFLEMPITSHRYSPLFYWRLYILGRLFPKRHKMLGDGIFLAQPGRKKSVLTNFTWNHASSDGFYASKLNKITDLKAKDEYMVVIGHPKSMTEYSFEKLEQYILKQKKKHYFTTFSELSKKII